MEPQIIKAFWYQYGDPDGEQFWCDELLPEEEYGKPSATVHGYGARLSMPGYLDCTEWDVFETEAEAAEYLLTTYYDSPDDELSDTEREEAAELLGLCSAEFRRAWSDDGVEEC